MAKYLLFYVGGDQPQSEEEGKKVMEAWTNWFTSLGGAVVDPGNPTNPGKSIAPDKSVSAAIANGTGYSVLQADNYDEAIEMAKNCPHLEANGTVDVYETFDVM